VRFDDRSADRQSHAHAAGFGGEKGVEQFVLVLGGEPDAAVLYRDQHLMGFVAARLDHQLAPPILDRLHRLNAVNHQVDEHLLQLDPVGLDHGQAGREFRPQRHPMSEHLMLHQDDGLLNDVVDVERRLHRIGLFRQRAQALDHLARPFAIFDDASRGAARLDKIGSFAVKPSYTCRGVGDESREGLVHLVSDRGAELAQGCHARNMREFRLRLLQFRLGALALVDESVDQNRNRQESGDRRGALDVIRLETQQRRREEVDQKTGGDDAKKGRSNEIARQGKRHDEDEISEGSDMDILPEPDANNGHQNQTDGVSEKLRG